MAELSGLEVLALLKEVNSALRGAYINNIYSSGVSQLIRLRKPEAEDTWLVVSPKRGAWVSEKVAERGETSEFTSRLRRELERSRFAGASQLDLDRVFQLDFEGNLGRRLVVELMPPGNIILLDSNGRVVFALNEVRSKNRRVVPREEYMPPRQSRLSPSKVSVADVERILGEEKSAGRAIGRHVALPRKYVAESLSRLGLTDESPSSTLKGKESDVVKAINGLVAEAEGNPRPTICMVDGAEDIFVIPPRGAEVVASSDTVSALCDRLFLEELAGEEEGAPEASKMKELEVTIGKLKSESATLLADAAKLRTAAEAAGTMPLPQAAELLAQSGVKATREPTSSSSVASFLFDQAKTLERRSSEDLLAAEKLGKKLSKMAPAGPPKTMLLPARKREWFEKFRWFVTSGGKLAVGGRDAQSNSMLIRRHLTDEDVVYHADLFGSPFFVLKDGLGQSDLEVLEVAQATVSFSSGWKTGLGAADAYWVLRDQVSSSAESGEYLAKGSFVIRGKKNFVKHATIQVAVGVDARGRVVAGPESAVARACQLYVVLIPHREKATDTAKRILKDLAEARGSPVPSLDDIVRALPAGGGKITRRMQGAQEQNKP